ncbi:MAG TPA: hypothetical protein VJT50_08535 [Pyrinomonadaceae bacterium]|nr:hypothetical protein [Pyrinomonadaceae bacterium]
MAIMKGKANGGQGGKRGHSNMDHWVFSEEHKTAARKQRRLDAKAEIVQDLTENEDCGAEDVTKSQTNNELSR